MKSIILVFVITVLFLVGMTKFTNDTNYNEAIRYAELSEYYNQQGNNNDKHGGGGVFLESIDLEISMSGEVKNTKTFKISYGSFLSQAIDKVGGITENADLRCVNMNYVILENTAFYIPGGKDLEKVSINNADEEELMTLPSVGGITANRIIEYRETYGTFESLESIMQVNGIGSQTYLKIRDLIIL